MAVPNCEFFEFFPCTGANIYGLVEDIALDDGWVYAPTEARPRLRDRLGPHEARAHARVAAPGGRRRRALSQGGASGEHPTI
jgi:hypothetical protein